MDGVTSGLVDIVREYLEVHERMVEQFRRFRAGDLEFAPVRDLCADDDRSPLFRLKERCHALFRRGGDRAPMRRAALFDLAVGSLFHEAMKFRENFYQQVVYAPKVRALRDSVAAGDPEEAELFREFDKIQLASEARMHEALQETEALLAHTGDQLWALLRGRRDGLITRYLIEQRGRIEQIHSEGLEGLLETMHGDVTRAHVSAGMSYLESAHFEQAIAALTTACERLGAGAEAAALERLVCYARGMRSFVDGDYAASLDQLDTWIAAAPDPDSAEVRYASLAHSAISRVGRLVKDGSLVSRANKLAARIEPLLETQAARSAS